MTRSIARIAKLERAGRGGALSAIPDAALEARILGLAGALGYADEWRDRFPDPTSDALAGMIATVRREADAFG